jgi:hypothetical protein
MQTAMAGQFLQLRGKLIDGHIQPQLRQQYTAP